VEIELTGVPQMGPPWITSKGLPITAGTWIPLRRAKIVLDPSIGWRCREYKADLQTQVGGLETWYGHITYDETQKPFPLVREIRTRYCLAGYKQEEPSREEVRAYTLYVDEHIPDSEFTLSAYGFAEPPGVTWERSTPWWLYGILVGFALILVSGILYKVIRRLRMRAT
jgi:hypothetical protein